MIFVEPGVKVNGAYYRMLPDIRHIAGEFFVFQQDSALEHRACESNLNARFLVSSRRIYGRRTAPTSIQSTTKSGASCAKRFYQTKVQNVDDLKQLFIDLWNGMEQGVIDDAIDQWRSRLRACVQAKGGHFEYSL